MAVPKIAMTTAIKMDGRIKMAVQKQVCRLIISESIERIIKKFV